MADAQSEADKIRNKRLAKLGGSQPSPTTTPVPGESSASSTTPAPVASTPSKPENSAPQTESPNLATATANPPPSQLGLKSGNASPAPKINITNKSSVPQKRDSDSGSRSQSRARIPGAAESDEVWENRFLSTVLRTTLDESHEQDLHGNKLSYLPGVKNDLEEAGSPLLLSLTVFDQAILESASGKGGDFLKYLMGCWKRVVRMARGASSADKGNPARAGVLREARRLVMSYIIFAVTMPDMFDQRPWNNIPLAQYLAKTSEDDDSICHDFLAEAVSRFEEDESIKDALVRAMEHLSMGLAFMETVDDRKPYIEALRNFCQYPPLVVALSQSPTFYNTDIEAPRIEKDTLLGPFFAESPLKSKVHRMFFSGANPKDKAAVSAAQNAMRMTLKNHQDDLFEIANRFIRVKESRPRMLDWFALTINKNHHRRAMRVDPERTSSDGFMTNVTVILERLCDPFVDATFSKIDRIDIDYFRRNPRVDITSETKMNADQSESDEFYSKKLDGENNFISECFFLTVAAHHYGTEAMNARAATMQKDVKYMEKELEKFESERHKYASNPAQLAMFERTVQKFRDAVENAHGMILSRQGVMLDETIQGRSMQFMRYVIVWLVRVAAAGVDYPKQQPNLPLPSDQPEAFKCLPEYFLEGIVDNFKFITRSIPQLVTSTQCSEIILLCITFLRSSSYIRNPYLKASLVTILYYGTLPYYSNSKGIFGDVLFADSFATEHLLHAVMQFYIECESTGTHTQFYDKFNIRYEIFQIIKCIWGNPVYREKLGTEAKVNIDFFVRFVNLLLNDVTYVLDESFTAFAQIHDTSKALREGISDETLRKETEEKLENAKSRAKSYMSLTSETVAMLKLFTNALSDSFAMPEIIQRLADMLDYNLDALVGPRQSQLKIENPQDYGFNAKAMLTEITDVYLNLKDKDRFWIAIARDGRSYKPANFAKASSILRKFALKSPEELQAWEQLAVHVAAAKEADEEEEADLGEIPDEFLDPLLSDIMTDPVILPKSRVTIDRATIVSHLLSDMTDPFNRTPLKIEDVIPDTELKAKIEAFRAERKAARAAEKAHLKDDTVEVGEFGGAEAAAGGDADAMDTSL